LIWEEEKIKEVKERYGIDLTIEQLAWWRKQAKTKFHRDEAMALQEYPWTEEEAFAAKAYSIFQRSIEVINQYIQPPIKVYRVEFGKKWFEMSLEESAFGTLKIWEHWENRDRHAKYVIGVDPSYSTSN